MELTTQKKQVQGVEVIEVSKPLQIKKTLMELLYVPNEALKPKIVSEIVAFYKRKSVSPEYNLFCFFMSGNISVLFSPLALFKHILFLENYLMSFEIKKNEFLC